MSEAIVKRTLEIDDTCDTCDTCDHMSSEVFVQLKSNQSKKSALYYQRI